MARHSSIRMCVAATLVTAASIRSTRAFSLGASAATPPLPPAALDTPTVRVVTIGDPTGTGSITSLDALVTLSAVVKTTRRRGDLVDPLADVNCDGPISAVDALILLSHIVGLDTSGTCVGRATTIHLTLAASDDTLTALGHAATLTAVVTDSVGSRLDGALVRWSRLDGDGLDVDSTGLVIAQGNGTARIRALIGGAADTLTIISRQVAAGMELTPAATEVLIGDSVRLTADAWDRRGRPMETATVAWSTSEPAVAIVDSTGLVRTGGEGSVQITAELDTLSRTAALSTRGNDSTVVSLSFDDGLRMTAVLDSSGGTLAFADGAGVQFNTSYRSPRVRCSTPWRSPVLRSSRFRALRPQPRSPPVSPSSPNASSS